MIEDCFTVEQEHGRQPLHSSSLSLLAEYCKNFEQWGDCVHADGLPF